MRSESGSRADRRVGAADRAVWKIVERLEGVYSGAKPRMRAERRRAEERGFPEMLDDEDEEARDSAEEGDSAEGAGEGTRWVLEDPGEPVEDGMVEFRL